MSLIDDLRIENPALAKYSDEDLLNAAHKVMGGNLADVADQLGYQAPSSTMGKEFYAGGNQYLAGMGNIGAAMGIPGAAEYTARKKARAEALQGMSTAPHSWEEMKFGDPEKGILPYFGQLAAGSAPYMAEAASYSLADVASGGALTPAIIARYAPAAARLGISVPEFLGGQGLRAGATFAERRAALAAAEESAPGVARTAMLPVVTYPSSLGDVLGNQQEETPGRYDLPSAAAAAVPYSLLNIFGTEGAVTHGALPRLGIKGLEKSFAGRAASGAVATGLSEGLNEAGQEVMNQAGRMGVNPNATLTDPAALERYKESFIGGAVLGGLPGSLHAFGGKRAALDTKTPTDLTKRLPDQAYEEQYAQMHGMTPGALGLRTPEQQAAFAQQQSEFAQGQAERDLMGGLYPPAAPVYSNDAQGDLERAYGVPPGTFASPGIAPKAKGRGKAAAAPAGVAPVVTEAPPVDAKTAQITDTNIQLRDPYIASHLPADHSKTVPQIRAAIRTLVGDPQTVDEAAETLKGKIAATLAPQQGSSKAERDIRAGKMIQFYDNIVGTPEAERQTVDEWRDRLKAESAEAARVAALANAKVGQTAKVPGAVTTIDPTTLNAQTPPTSAATGVPPKPKSPAEMAAYHAAIVPLLKEGIAEEDLQALMLTRGKEAVGDENTNVSLPNPELTAKLQQTPEGRKKLADLAQKAAEQAELSTGVEATAGTVRGVAETLGVSPSTLHDRVNRALAKVKENAAKNDLPEEAAHELLGLQTSLDVLDTAPPSTAYEGTQRVGVAPSDEFEDTAGFERGEVAGDEEAAPQGDAPVARAGEEMGDEEGPEAEAGDKGAVSKQRVEFENKWVDDTGAAIKHIDVQEAAEDYANHELGYAAGDPAWEQLSPALQLQWTRGYLASLKNFPKEKQVGERRTYTDAVRTSMAETQEQDDEARTKAGDTRTGSADTGAERQATEGANVAAGTGDSGQKVGGVQGTVQGENKGRVPPAATEGEKPADTEKAGAGTAAPTGTGTATATGGTTEPAKPAKPVKITRKKTTKPGEKTLETHKVETARERAERKWNEAAAVAPQLGNWWDLPYQAREQFVQAEEKDQKLADADTLKKKYPDKWAYEEKPDKNEPPEMTQARRDVIDAMNGKITIDALIDKLLKTSLTQGQKIAITERFGDNMSPAQQRRMLGTETEEDKKPSAMRSERGEKKKTSTTADHTMMKLKKLFFSYKRFDARVSVVQTVEEARGLTDEEIGPNDQALTIMENPNDRRTWRVIMIADNIDKGSELSVFLHEMAGHIGMEGLIGKYNMVKLANKVNQWAALDDGSLRSTIAKRVVARVDNAEALAKERGYPFEARNAMEETIAYFLEEAVDHGINPTAISAATEFGRWFRTLWAAAKVALRKIGLDRFDSLTPQDIVNLGFGAARLEMTGVWHGTAALFRNFNKNFMGSGEGAQAFSWGHYGGQQRKTGKEYWKQDVKRKTKLGEMRVTYDGKEITREDAVLDPANDARYRKALWEAGMFEGDPREYYQKEIADMEATLGETDVILEKSFRKATEKQLAHFRKALAEYDKIDSSKLKVVQSKDKKPAGSLMRADIAAQEHELVDWDAPLSLQSKLVQDAFQKLLPETFGTPRSIGMAYNRRLHDLPDEKQRQRIWNVVYEWYEHQGRGKLRDMAARTLSEEDNKAFLGLRDKVVKEMYTPLKPHMKAGDLYEMLAHKLGSDKAASEALAAEGVKGTQFFDHLSRPDPDTAAVATRKVMPELLGTKINGRDVWENGEVMLDRESGDISVEVVTKRTEDGKPTFAVSSEPLSTANNPLPNHDALTQKLAESDYEWADLFGSRNLVAFDDKTIQRVVTQVGAKSRKVSFSQRMPTAEGAKQATTKHLTNVQSFAQRHGLGLMITEDIADLAKLHGLPEARTYVDVAKQREGSREEFEQPVSKIAAMYETLPEKERGTDEGSVNKFLHDATLRGDTKGIERLSASGQAMVKAVFKHGGDTLALKQKLIAENVAKEYDRRIAEETDDAEKAKLRKERNTLLKKFSKLMTVKESDTYAPLKRFGDYVVSAKSKEYVEAEKNNDQEWINDNQSNPAHVQVHFADSQGEADALEQEIKRDLNFKGGQTYAAAREADIHNHRDLFRAFPVLQSRLAAEYPTQGVSPMARIIRDLYLQALAENSARKSEMRRRGITGASTDMVRAFVTQGRADAAFVANLKHNDALQNAVQAMRDGADRDRGTLTPYLNEMLKRHAASYENHSNAVANRFKRVTSIWMLATNPSYYLQQIVQPWSMSLPVIAGRHGYFRTVRALQEGYKSLGSVLKGTGLTGAIDWANAPADVRDMLHAVSRNGAIDITNSMDQGEWQLVDKGTMGAGWNRVDQKLRGINTRVEAINRASTAIASYRMELARNGGDKAAATDYAERMVRQTHGSYDGSNTPRYMQGPVAQVATQFRRFQIIQISLIARLAHTAFKGANATEKGIARRALTYTLLHTAALGGALGMPGAALVANLIARLFGPSDEPPDFEKEAREAIGDQTVSDLLLKGVPAMLGVDLSNKLGMGQILSIAPFADFPTDRKSFEKYVFAALGPVVGLGAKGIDGMAQIYHGELSKGGEQLLPTGFANVMKGIRYGSEGVSLRSGDTVMSKDDIGFADALLQGMGMPTSTITHQQRLSQTKYEFDTYYKDRASELIRDYQQARKGGEPTTEIMSDWRDLQEARVRNGYARQPVSLLIKSAQQQAKYERNTTGGVEFTKANKRFVQEQANL